jgi:hypothetical protein
MFKRIDPVKLEGFGLVVLCQKCTPRLNLAVKAVLVALHKAIA